MKIYLLVLSMLLSGCSPWRLGETKEKEERHVEASFKATVSPTEGGQRTISAMGETMTFPASALIELFITSEQSNWYSFIGSFDYTSKTGLLILIGALCLAAAGVLCYLGMWKIGVCAGIFGLLMVSCGVAINSYPWVFFIVLLLAGGVVVYMVYQMSQGKGQTMSFAKVVAAIDNLKTTHPDGAKQITDALSKDNLSKVIKKFVGKIRNEA